MATERPIIVVGCPRSGTTLLQIMLHTHPRIAIPPENRFVLPTYSKRMDFGDLRDPGNRRRLAKSIVKGKRSKFADFGLDSKALIDEIVAGPPTIGSALATVFRAYAQRFGKPRWGDKRPMYATQLHIIRRLFPTAQFVSIVRDGRDCVASLKEMSWFRHDLYHAAATWARSVDLTRRAARTFGPDTFFELHYERLVGDPERELRGLCDFLGEDYHPAIAEPAATAAVAVPERKSHHARTHEPVTGARIGSWRERLEPWELAMCEAVLGRRLRMHGYELSGAPAPPLASRLRYEGIAARRRLRVPQPAVRAYERVRRCPPLAARLEETVTIES